MAFYFSRTAQNLLKRGGKVRNGSVFQKKSMDAFLTSAAVALFIPSNRWLETVLLPFTIKKLECLYL